MRYKGYIGKVEVDSEANLLHGEVTGVRDVITFQGGTLAEAAEAFRESVDDYLQFCNERGQEPEAPLSGNSYSA
jgi:predicted HicB family RNase H-like nuclease